MASDTAPMPDRCQRCIRRQVCIDRLCGPCWRDLAIWMARTLSVNRLEKLIEKCP